VSKHGSLVPNFIEAQSPKALRSLMIETNIKDKAENQYYDIQFYTNRMGKVRWIAWYKQTVSNKDFIEAAQRE